MFRKLSMVAAVALVALTSSISTGSAQAHPWGWHGGWGYGGWRYGGWGYHHYWGPRYYGYGYIPYPRCYVTVYGNTVCY